MDGMVTEIMPQGLRAEAAEQHGTLVVRKVVDVSIGSPSGDHRAYAGIAAAAEVHLLRLRQVPGGATRTTTHGVAPTTGETAEWLRELLLRSPKRA